MTRVESLLSFLVRERLWFFLGVVYLVAWVVPFGWMKDYWLTSYSTLAAQPFILPLFLLVLWGRRKQIQDDLLELQHVNRFSKKPEKTGNYAILLLGCLLYFFAHFSRLALAGILGLVLILVGTIVFIYGIKVIRVLKAPLLYLLAIVPWLPESFVGRITAAGLKLFSMPVQLVLNRVGKGCSITPEVLLSDGGNLTPTPYTLYGLHAAVAAIVVFWGYGLYRRLSAQRIISQIAMGVSAVALVHLLRLFSVCFLLGSNRPLAVALATANSWIFTIPSLALAFVLIRATARVKRPEWLGSVAVRAGAANRAMLRPVDRALSGSANAGAFVGKGILVVFKPLTWLANLALTGLGYVGKLFTASNRGVESLLRRGDKKLQNRRKR